MKRHFYHHLIEIDSLFLAMDELDFSDSQRLHLSRLIDANLHHSVLDVILSQLDESDKKLFMHHLGRDDQSKIWELLNQRSEKIEEKIRAVVSEVKEELHQDIHEAKKMKGGSA